MPTPLTAFFRPPPNITSDQILFSSGNRNVFGLFDVDASRSPAALTVSYYGTDSNALVFSITITEEDTMQGIAPPGP